MQAGVWERGWEERGENLQEDRPPARSSWGQGDQAPSWSPISQALGSCSQVSGEEEQEEETVLRGPEGLGVVTPRGADPWVERAEEQLQPRAAARPGRRVLGLSG